MGDIVSQRRGEIMKNKKKITRDQRSKDCDCRCVLDGMEIVLPEPDLDMIPELDINSIPQLDIESIPELNLDAIPDEGDLCEIYDQWTE